MKTLGDLYREIQNSEGYRIHKNLSSLNNTEKIFYRNFSELLAIEKYAKEKPELMYVKNKRNLDDFQLELARRFHNYLASVKSLVDHTRRLTKTFNFSEKNLEQYDLKRKKLFGKDGLIFLQQLREYVQHYELLPTGLLFQVERVNGMDQEKISLRLFKDQLMGFSDWKNASKFFLSKSDKEIDLIELVKQYTVAVAKFYSWFYKFSENKHERELKELDSLFNQYNDLIKKAH